MILTGHCEAGIFQEAGHRFVLKQHHQQPENRFGCMTFRFKFMFYLLSLMMIDL